MIRQFKETAKASLRHAFHLGQRAGVDILPRHFYSEVPNIQRLKQTDHWREPYSLIEIAGADDIEGQAATLQSWFAGEVGEAARDRDVHAEAAARNGEPGYGGRIDCSCLYAFVRSRQPKQIVQIGCGVSTAICLIAAKDSSYQPKITCIEPYPTDFLLREAEAGTIELIQKPVEALPLTYFEHLNPGDLFFVDSTHTLGPAGEVTRIILEMLPRLPAGCVAHFHDIWLPYDYVPKVLDGTVFFWHETALLMAYLSGNSRRRVLLSMSLIHHRSSSTLQEVMPCYTPMPMERGVRQGTGHYPNSFYLEVGA